MSPPTRSGSAVVPDERPSPGPEGPGPERLAPPPGRARLAISAFILAWLVWQVASPLAYYTGSEVSDERFAWRMFSGVWFHERTCAVSVTESVPGNDGALVPRGVNPGAWKWQLERNRLLVVEKFLRSRCQRDPSVVAVEIVRTCPVESRSLPIATRRLDCRAGSITSR
jgi:hypothetical protein